jgi:hypothetical protein
MGQKAKYSERADNFRFAPMNGHHQARTPCRKSAKGGSGGISRTCPLFPQQQTFVEASGTSALCQQRTYAPQQLLALFDHPRRAQQIRPALADIGGFEPPYSQCEKTSLKSQLNFRECSPNLCLEIFAPISCESYIRTGLHVLHEAPDPYLHRAFLATRRPR